MWPRRCARSLGERRRSPSARPACRGGGGDGLSLCARPLVWEAPACAFHVAVAAPNDWCAASAAAAFDVGASGARRISVTGWHWASPLDSPPPQSAPVMVVVVVAHARRRSAMWRPLLGGSAPWPFCRAPLGVPAAALPLSRVRRAQPARLQAPRWPTAYDGARWHVQRGVWAEGRVGGGVDGCRPRGRCGAPRLRLEGGGRWCRSRRAGAGAGAQCVDGCVARTVSPWSPVPSTRCGLSGQRSWGTTRCAPVVLLLRCFGGASAAEFIQAPSHPRCASLACVSSCLHFSWSPPCAELFSSCLVIPPCSRRREPFRRSRAHELEKTCHPTILACCLPCMCAGTRSQRTL